MRQIAIIIVMLFFSEVSYSQGQQTTSTVDATTYQLWSQQDWNTLIETGNLAIKNGIDFYYLRYRLGVAYYEKQNYHRAAQHFQKAFEMNDSDELLKEYLYYSYLFSGRNYEAYFTEQTFSKATRRKLNLGKDLAFKNIYVSWSGQQDAPESATENFNSSIEIEGLQTVSTGFNLFQIGGEHSAGNRTWFSHTYTHLQKSYFLFSNIDGSTVINPDETVYLNQYYIGTTTLLKPGLDLRFGLHYINLLNYVTTVTSAPRPRSFRTGVTNNDFVGSVGLYRRFSYVETGISSSVSNLNGATQLQQNAILSLFPFGNLRFYTSSILYYQSEKAGNQDWRTDLIFTQKAGLKLMNRIWTEAFMNFGDQLNVVTDNGHTIFNDTNVTTSRYGIRLHTLITNKMNLLLDYSNIEKESRFTGGESGSVIQNAVPYETQNLTVTLLWNI
ncbi:tetratricopeptide repeat protein [Rhodohalobacter sp.]|uniref:tetratricopeptide repeat protein n=1 Tax=Rhodohalobacter sp. TaxID=1974210 RepID=UPI003565175A